MIAHVAQADEQRGRVVLWLGASDETQDTAVDAALRLAQAFESEIESVFIEDRQLFDLAALPFAREIPLSGRGSRAMTTDALTRDIQVHASALQRQVLLRARAADVKAQALDMYLNNVGIRKVARFVGASPASILNWIAAAAEAMAQRLARAGAQVRDERPDVIEMDEIYTYIQKNGSAPSYGLLILGEKVALLRITSATKGPPAP